ncbi:MAG: helix-turn-helix transcriptional regulator [Dietzia sp.]|uniref:helix-turn-helix domain-containing protein n=1 Tax=Dietzia TaxID=37914 RepID=UPI0015CDF4AF|nr:MULTISPECIES: helix-turn-helix transcriptional regulator [Dietzia]MBB1030025.1 helix-turn-helix transcriptional regulator [Dietzia sp. SLG310A2-38A2]MBC7306939.1 helix-turn-helix transcriptional regulator [Dietzia sp.]
MPRRAGHISPTALRSAVARRGATAEDLAVALAVSTSTVEGWLSARRTPEPPLLVALARVLKVRPADLTLVSEDVERLPDLRIHAGLLQAEAAAAAGLRQPQLSKMERGVAIPRSELCEPLARVYGLEPERVLAAWTRSRDDRRRHADSKLS